MRALLTFALAFTSASFSSCLSVPPGAASAVEAASLLVPAASWSQAGGDALTEPQFWSSFNSPTLDALVEEGLLASPTLAAAALRVTSAAAFLEAAAGAGSPQVQASLDAARSRINTIGFGIPGGNVNTTSNLSLGLAVNWEVDLWGRLAAAERGAAASLDASGFDLIAARQSLAAQICKLAISIGGAQSELALSAQALDVTQAAIKSAERQREAGIDSSRASLTAQADHARAQAAQRAAARRMGQLGPALMALIGRPAGQGAGLTPDEKAELAELFERPLAPLPDLGIPAELLVRRPDLAAAEAGIRAVQAGAEVARANLFPALSLGASAGTNGDELKNLLDGNFRVWNLGANLVAPLLNGGRLRAAEDQAIAERDGALFAFAAAALLAFAEVEQALDAEAQLTDQVLHLDKARHLAQQLTGLLQGKHQRGTASTAEVLASRSASIQAQLASLASRTELFTNRVDLFLALGGGFDAASN